MIKKIIILLILAFYAHRAWGMEFVGPKAPKLPDGLVAMNIPGRAKSPVKMRSFSEKQAPEFDDDEDDLPPLLDGDEDVFTTARSFLSRAKERSLSLEPSEAACYLLRLLSTDDVGLERQDIHSALGIVGVRSNEEVEVIRQVLGILRNINLSNLAELIQAAGFKIDDPYVPNDPLVIRALQRTLRYGLGADEVGVIIADPLEVGVYGHINHSANSLASTLHRIVRRTAAKKEALEEGLEVYLQPVVSGYDADVSENLSSAGSPSDKDGRARQ